MHLVFHYVYAGIVATLVFLGVWYLALFLTGALALMHLENYLWEKKNHLR
jgi:hypothetical protein